jgi:hypothetical protein
MSDTKPKQPLDLKSAIVACTDRRKSDMFLYSGPIYSDEVNQFIGFSLKHRKHENISLILTTYGGDAHAAYRLARYLQSYYSKIRLLVIGPCKSAGTLVTICANELAFGPFGELGPLDIQVSKKDDLMAVASGLDTFQAFAILRANAFAAFESYMLDILERSMGAISTKTACEVATQLVTGLFQPLMAQLDPQRMGEMQRMMDIAKAYGERLGKHNLKAGAISKLLESYPSHSFIIDYKEAAGLFKNVSQLTPAEFVVMPALFEQESCSLVPADGIVCFDLSALGTSEGDGGVNETAQGSPADSGANDPPERGEATPGKESGAAKPAKRRRRAPVAPE